MYIYVLHNLTVWFSSFSKWIDLKTNFWGESNVIYFKFDSEYYHDPIMWQQHDINNQIRQLIWNWHEIT